MTLGDIIGAGIVAVGVAVGGGDAIAEINPWQVQPGKKEIIVHIKKGDTLSDIIKYLDHANGNDDPNDAARNLNRDLRKRDITYANCGNEIKPRLMEAGRDITFRGKALEAIDPEYGRRIADKNIQVVTDSKVPKKWGRSLKSDLTKLSSNNILETNNRIGKFFLNGEVGYSILGSSDEDLGGGSFIDVNAGYQLPSISFGIGGRAGSIEGDKYFRYKRSFFGFLNEGELEEEYLSLIELYAQLMFGNDNFQIGGGFGVKNVSDIEAGMSYGWREGEGGISKGHDRYFGAFGKLQLMVPFYKDTEGRIAYVGVTSRYGEYETDEGLKLNETSFGANVGAKF